MHKFDDLSSGGRALAAALEKYREAADTIVIAIVRGGVFAGVEIADALQLPLDVILIRPLFQQLPGHPLCAMRVAGTLVIDDGVAAQTSAPESIERVFVAEALDALRQREIDCRGDRAPAEITGRTVILVDNGMRTGGTMTSAIRALRTLEPLRVVAAVPVSTDYAVPLIEKIADETICLSLPAPFGHVAMGYERFEVPNEQRIHDLLAARDGVSR